MEPAVSVRPCLKTHESQNDNSLNVCPVVEDEMDEEDIDDKEEQSEESRGVRVGKKMMTPTLVERRNTNGRTFRIEVGADFVSLHGQAILLIVAESLQGRSKVTKT